MLNVELKMERTTKLAWEGIKGRVLITRLFRSWQIPTSVGMTAANAFPPNGDGVNDVFQISYGGLTIVNCQLSIFDRWGGELFSGEGVSSGWDGKKAGKDCPGGVYVYKIVFSVDGVTGNQERVGTVMLVR
jgi:gliding motility-associated-like protein